MHEGELVASSLVLSHREQLDRLRTSCPAAMEIAVVAGDPCFDRILASIPLRHMYRASLGVHASQRLVLVSSTWGPDSLYANASDLVLKVRAELPLDEYAVAVALHPNTWSAHSPWQIRRWLHAAERSGAIVFPADEGWRAGLVAADLVIGDHGSVTFYGAALGRPVLLASAPQHAVDPASAIGRLLPVADVVDFTSALRAQLEDVISRGQSAEVRQVADLATSAPLRAFTRLRSEFYRLLQLSEPEHPAQASAVPLPDKVARTTVVQAVEVTLDHHDDVLRATITRSAAEHVLHGRPPAHGTHLAVVATDEPRDTALQLADIIVDPTPGEAGSWITATLNAMPGAMLATKPLDDKTWLIGTREGKSLRLATTGPAGSAWASVVLAWLASGRSLGDLPEQFELTAGGTVSHASLT